MISFTVLHTYKPASVRGQQRFRDDTAPPNSEYFGVGVSSTLLRNKLTGSNIHRGLRLLNTPAYTTVLFSSIFLQTTIATARSLYHSAYILPFFMPIFHLKSSLGVTTGHSLRRNKRS
ncbi:hypothetical protein AG1IA_08318 [Rhizoctonia solani AG-1 IA]|uniref:Uncharacterized protein n=1 Tax=Thanatephorus cucumeris (strain AG1-IA) TaxID=983506 RepID=L8WMS7_THACA|nr:hypothetical protein AG1IA_08318 [Rhizoctonia solani AG-1 IA]